MVKKNDKLATRLHVKFTASSAIACMLILGQIQQTYITNLPLFASTADPKAAAPVIPAGDALLVLNAGDGILSDNPEKFLLLSFTFTGNFEEPQLILLVTLLGVSFCG